MGMPQFATLLVSGTLAAAAAAQTSEVWRCGNGSYSTTPCPGGVAIDAADARTPEQRRQAQDAAKREAALADRLTAERRAAERRVVPTVPANLGPAASAPRPPASASRTHAKRKRHARPLPDPNLSPPMRALDPAPRKP